MNRISELGHNLENYLKKFIHCKRQGLKASHISGVSITFLTRLHQFTKKKLSRTTDAHG